MEWKSWFKRQFGSKYHWTLLGIIAVIFALYYYFGDRLTGSLSENVLAEAFGLAATVLIVERLIRSQKEQEWQPTRDMIFADIRNHVWSCITTIFSVYDIEQLQHFVTTEEGSIRSRPDIEIWNDLLNKFNGPEIIEIKIDDLERISDKLSLLEANNGDMIFKYKGILEPLEMKSLFQSEKVLFLHRTTIGPVIYHSDRGHNEPGLAATLLGLYSHSEDRLKESTISHVNFYIETFRQFGGHDNFSFLD